MASDKELIRLQPGDKIIYPWLFGDVIAIVQSISINIDPPLDAATAATMTAEIQAVLSLKDVVGSDWIQAVNDAEQT